MEQALSPEPLGERFAPDACLIAPDGAEVHGETAIRSEGAHSFAHAPHPTLVLRRLGAEWKLAIAAPWGWAPAPRLEAVGAG